VTLDELNHAPRELAMRELLRCCGATRWAERMIAMRPFADRDALLQAAEDAADELMDDDWLAAFGAHPRIGEKSESAWSQREQAAALNAEAAAKQKLARANAEYEQKFGFIFIVFASGKTPGEILKLLEARMRNDRSTEIANAAAEQRRITRSRIINLLDS
jgi:OHCU decarboxylase